MPIVKLSIGRDMATSLEAIEFQWLDATQKRVVPAKRKSANDQGSIQYFKITPRSDLTLTVGDESHGDAAHFLVSRHAMMQASPVWERMLNPNTGHFLEAQNKVVRLPEYKTQAMRAILSIAHLDLAKIPSSCSSANALELVILCDKYDCLQLLRPWMEIWPLGWEKDSPDVNTTAHIQLDYMVRGLTGDAQCAKLSTAFDYFFRNAVKNKDGILEIDKEGTLSQTMQDTLPAEAYKNIVDGRDSLLKALLPAAYYVIEEIFPAMSEEICACSTKGQRSKVLLKLIKCLGSVGCWLPFPQPKSYTYSIRALVSCLVDCHRVLGNGHDHSCNFDGFFIELEDIIEDARLLLHPAGVVRSYLKDIKRDHDKFLEADATTMLDDLGWKRL